MPPPKTLLGRESYLPWHDEVCPEIAFRAAGLRKTEHCCFGCSWVRQDFVPEAFRGRTCYQVFLLTVLDARCRALVESYGSQVGPLTIVVGMGSPRGEPFWVKVSAMGQVQSWLVTGPTSNTAFHRFGLALAEFMKGAR